MSDAPSARMTFRAAGLVQIGGEVDATEFAELFYRWIRALTGVTEQKVKLDLNEGRAWAVQAPLRGSFVVPVESVSPSQDVPLFVDSGRELNNRIRRRIGQPRQTVAGRLDPVERLVADFVDTVQSRSTPITIDSDFDEELDLDPMMLRIRPVISGPRMRDDVGELTGTIVSLSIAQGHRFGLRSSSSGMVVECTISQELFEEHIEHHLGARIRVRGRLARGVDSIVETASHIDHVYPLDPTLDVLTVNDFVGVGRDAAAGRSVEQWLRESRGEDE